MANEFSKSPNSHSSAPQPRRNLSLSASSALADSAPCWQNSATATGNYNLVILTQITRPATLSP